MKLSWVYSFILSTSLLSKSLATTTCDADNHCPEDYPCCSSTGECGTGSYCLGTCDPRYSFNSTSCLPAPICKAGSYTPRLSNMLQDDKYLGNTTDYDFTYYGNLVDVNDTVRITMPSNSTGGLISSTFYVWYGKISYSFKTSHYAGVISAAILFSHVQDEIDCEFVGSNLEQTQSNFFFEGILNDTNVDYLTTTDTYENFHTYEIDWKEDSITWSIDGQILRTLNKADTYNSTSGIYQYPQTPSRLQFSIWPVTSSSAVGTQEWAGGAIDWDVSDFNDPGYLYVAIDNVEIECYDPPSGTTVDGNVSYIFDGQGYLSENVIISNNLTWIENLGNTGFNTGQDEYLEKISESSSSKLAASSNSIASISSKSSASIASISSQSFASIKSIESISSESISSVSYKSLLSVSSISAKIRASSLAAESHITTSKSSRKSSIKSSTTSSSTTTSTTSTSTTPSTTSSTTSSTTTSSTTTSTSSSSTISITSISSSTSSTSSPLSSSSSSSSSDSGFVQYVGISSSTSSHINNAIKNNISIISFIALIASNFFLL